MGDCGCGDFNATHRLAGPAGVTYAIGVTAGCNNCGSAAGVRIWRFCEETGKSWQVPDLPELPLFVYAPKPRGAPDDVDGEVYVPVVDPERLEERLVEVLKASDADAKAGGHEGPFDEHCMREALDESFDQAVEDTWNDWTEELRKAAERRGKRKAKR